jgi:hypothetical protein
VEALAQPFIRDFLIAENSGRAGEEPGFRKPGDEDPDGPKGTLYPVFIDPRDGPPAPGERSGNENNSAAVLSLIYTGGIPTGTLEKFRRRSTFDFWVRSKTPQLAGQIDSRLRLLLHDKRNWDMAGLSVIESLEWRPMQPVGNGPEGYSFTLSYIFELYAEGGL